MALMDFITLGLVLLSPVLATCPENKLKTCGSTRYCPGEYTCYNSSQLCPVLNGEPTKACGTDPYGCYKQSEYDCSKGKLVPKQTAKYPYTLKPVGGDNINNRLVNACNQAFYVTDVLPCSYCPIQVSQQGGVCPKGNQTVFIGESSLYVMVPGGQRFYVTKEGLLGYTLPHSKAFPDGAMFGVTAYTNGQFIVPGSDGWAACACTSSASCPGLGLQIYAKLPGKSFPSQVCSDLTLLTVPYNKAELGYGAWEYI